MHKHIVSVGFEPFAGWGDGSVTYDRHERVVVVAESEEAAMTLAAISAFPGLPLWAQATVEPHVHFDSSSRDCDGSYNSGRTFDFPEGLLDEDHTPRQALARYVAKFEMPYMLQKDHRLWSMAIDEERIFITEETEEGYSARNYAVCEDPICWDHIEHVTHYRDRTAERAGY